MNEGKETAAAAVEDHEQAVVAGRYEVLQTLGSGGFGVVHKAWDRLLHRTVAIKVMRMEALVAAGIKRDEVLKRFEREARTAARLTHPGIVTIYDIGAANGAPYLAMEYIDSVGLERVIAEEGRLPADRAALIALEVAEALEYAHGQGVLHRDVKPQNIMAPRSGARRVKLVDFGLAKALDHSDQLTRTGAFMGTISYASPEHVGGEPVDGRSDLWSIGCVLYEMLTGVKAFDGHSITDVVLKIMTAQPRAVRELEPGIPEDLAGVVAKAMAKDPAARYAGAGQLAADLRLFVRSRAGAGAEPSPPAGAVPAAVDGEDAATVIVPLAAAPAPAARPAVVAEAPIHARSRRRLIVTAVVAAMLVAGLAMAALMRRTRNGAGSTRPTPVAAMPEAAAREPLASPPALVVPPAPATPAAAVVAASAAPAGRIEPSARAARSPRRPAFGGAPVTSEPPGAAVSIDGREAGTAPPAVTFAAGPSQIDAPPEKVSLEPPVYPRGAPPLRGGRKVAVTVSYVVGVDGSVSDVRVTKSSGIRAVDEAVVAAVRKARYRPGTRNGAPVATRMLHGFSFRGE